MNGHITNNTDLGSGMELSLDNLPGVNLSAANPDEILFTNEEAIVITTVTACLCIFGVVANVATFAVIYSSKDLKKSPFNIFILSLCISDLMASMNSPFVLYRRVWGYRDYLMPVAICKATVGLQQWFQFVTVQHILLLSILRVTSLKFPQHFKKFTVKLAKATIWFIWVETFFAASLFYLIASTVYRYRPGNYKTSCSGVSKEWKHIGVQYTRYSVPVLLLVPVFAIIVCAIIFAAEMSKLRSKRVASNQDTNRRRRSKENYALLQILLIVASFLIGYSLLTAYMLTKALDIRRIFSRRVKWQVLTTSFLLSRTSECLNPFFYNLGSSRIRRATMEYFRRKK